MFGEMVFNGLVSGLTLMLVVVGLTLVFGVLRIMNLAHGELYMLGAYILWWLFQSTGINYWMSIIAAMLMVAVLGILLERGIFRRFRAQLVPSVVVSVGLMIAMQGAIRLGPGKEMRYVQSPFSGQLHFLGFSLSFGLLVVVLAGTVLTVGLMLFLKKTRLGLAIRAVAQDATTAQLHGISLQSTSMVTMGIGSGLAAAAGGLLAPIYGLEPTMGFPVLLKAVIAIVLGGMGSVGGALVAALFVGMVESFTITLAGPGYGEAVLFFVVILMLLFRPRGLLGREVAL